MTAAEFLSWPAADEVFPVAMADGTRLPVYRRAGPAEAPALLFGHANGLAAGSYGPWLDSLASGAEIFAFDARGHGGAAWPEGALASVFQVDRFAEDLARIATALAPRLAGRPLLYAGHSLGAAAAIRLALLEGATPFARLLLFEPPIFPHASAEVHGEAAEKQSRLIAAAERRRARWSSPEGLYERLRGRGLFARFRDDLLRAHCRATLRPLAEGGFRLCCPPAVEAAIFRAHREADSWERLGTQPPGLDLALIGGDPALPDRDWVSAAMPELAARLGAPLAQIPGTGHMMIFEAPERCRELVLRWLARR